MSNTMGRCIATQKQSGGQQIDRLWDSVYPLVCKFARQYGNADTYEDLIQEGYIGFYTAYKKWDRKRNFTTWAYQWIRGRIIRAAYYLCRQDITPDFMVHDLGHKEMLVRVAVKKLPHKYQQAIILRYYQEYTVREIAISLGIHQNTVKQRLRKALKNIRDMINFYQQGDWI